MNMYSSISMAILIIIIICSKLCLWYLKHNSASKCILPDQWKQRCMCPTEPPQVFWTYNIKGFPVAAFARLFCAINISLSSGVGTKYSLVGAKGVLEEIKAILMGTLLLLEGTPLFSTWGGGSQGLRPSSPGSYSPADYIAGFSSKSSRAVLHHSINPKFCLL